jgi:hypothetical protein
MLSAGADALTSLKFETLRRLAMVICLLVPFASPVVSETSTTIAMSFVATVVATALLVSFVADIYSDIFLVSDDF